MKLPISQGALRFLAGYFMTVLIAALVLIVSRWSSPMAWRAILELVGASVWQASVWPLHLLLMFTSKG
ncbi:hypothetical protein LJC59_10375 [Desulfovibrio sp. OttesenSCG-928-A18]|nr:hypothetical protein [Desulfovibrio sp. OttesenSCG-928-A18]